MALDIGRYIIKSMNGCRVFLATKAAWPRAVPSKTELPILMPLEFIKELPHGATYFRVRSAAAEQSNLLFEEPLQGRKSDFIYVAYMFSTIIFYHSWKARSPAPKASQS